MAKNKVDYWSESSQNYGKSVDSALGRNTRPLINEKLRHEDHLGAVVESGVALATLPKRSPASQNMWLRPTSEMICYESREPS
jgi:hypothetical protein